MPLTFFTLIYFYREALERYTRIKMTTRQNSQGCLGSVDSRINVHTFFRQTDARHWNDVQLFFKLRDINKTSHEHYEIFMRDLKTIAGHSGVSDNVQKRARFLHQNTQYDKFMEKFLDLALEAKKNHAEASVQGLYLHVAQGADRIRARIDDSQTIPQKRRSASLKPTNSKKAAQQPLSSSPSSSSSSTVSRNDLGRRSSVSSEEKVTELKFCIDPDCFEHYTYDVGGANVGSLFTDYQRASTAVVNNLKIKAIVENLPCFLSMNYIWDVAVCPKNMSPETHKIILSEYTWPRSSIPENVASLCRKMDEQLADGENIDAGQAEGRELRSITIFYGVLEMKLPMEYLAFKNEIEDTYCHSFIDALFTRQFPTKSAYKLEWANKETDGSKGRRGNGYKPDAIISKLTRELAFVEIKPPKEQRCSRSYLEDLWKLANFCKDAIDLHLQSGIDIRKAAAVQIFALSQHHRRGPCPTDAAEG
ncbi:hypothetical protein BG011_007741 [Mortierella polycephala]|uniref:Uncharacterized protein n=1 Tax=Mortierella polycephala TaxID=41804 RepID=A0A9P6TXT3_9FUNG|nr:hypothetical protein BG011_007741 [Mortierella polycephala]